MNLSDHELDLLLAVVGPARRAPGRPEDLEKRRAPRLTVEAVAEMTICGGVTQRAHRVVVRCLSRAGVAVLDQHVMRVGDKFLLHLPRPDGRGPLRVHCTVANSRLTSDGRFRIGARFTVPAGHKTPLLDAPGMAGVGARLRRWFAA